MLSRDIKTHILTEDELTYLTKIGASINSIVKNYDINITRYNKLLESN